MCQSNVFVAGCKSGKWRLYPQQYFENFIPSDCKKAILFNRLNHYSSIWNYHVQYKQKINRVHAHVYSITAVQCPSGCYTGLWRVRAKVHKPIKPLTGKFLTTRIFNRVQHFGYKSVLKKTNETLLLAHVGGRAQRPAMEGSVLPRPLCCTLTLLHTFSFMSITDKKWTNWIKTSH